MKKTAKETKKPTKAAKPAETSAPAASSEIKPLPMERARQRVEEARKAAVSRVVSQNPSKPR